MNVSHWFAVCLYPSLAFCSILFIVRKQLTLLSEHWTRIFDEFLFLRNALKAPIYINIILFFFFFFFCFYWFYAIVHMFMLFFSTLSNGFFSLTLRKELSSFYTFLHIVYTSKKPWTMNNWGFMRVVDQKSLNKNMNKRVQNTEHGNTRTPEH